MAWRCPSTGDDGAHVCRMTTIESHFQRVIDSAKTLLVGLSSDNATTARLAMQRHRHGMNARPLGGILVISLEHAIAAPFCTPSTGRLGPA